MKTRIINKDYTRIINKDYIGVVKEFENNLKFVEVEIPQDNILIEEIEAMKKNDNRTLMDIQQLFTKYYPKDLQNTHYDYLYPIDYRSAYVNGVDYPHMLTWKEYEEIIENHKKWLNDEENLVKCCGRKDEVEKLKAESEKKYLEWVKERVDEKMREYVKKLRESFKYQRFMWAYQYKLKLKEIENESNAKMWSTDEIGWKKFEYIVNDDITIYVMSNFGYGSASYFFCNLKYKDINILPYTALIKYYNVQMIDFIRHTREYAIDRSSWEQVFKFVVLTANMAKNEPERFIKEWIINEIKEMMIGMRKVMNSPKEELEYHLGFNRDIEIGLYHFRNCTPRDIEDYEVLPTEKIIAFKAEKITGCLFLLEGLRKLTEITQITQIIVPYIEEIEEMNIRIQPEIEEHMANLNRSIKKLQADLDVLNNEIEKLEPMMTRHNNGIEEVRQKMNKKANEKRKHTWVEYFASEAEQEYRKTHPEYVKLKNEYDELRDRRKDVLRRIKGIKRFFEILNNCMERIQKFSIAV